MKMPQKNSTRAVFSLLVIGFLLVLFLVACTGRTVIDVNIDPTTGAGGIVINPGATSAPAADSGAGGADFSTIALFAIIVSLFLGTIAIVLAVARRPRE